jgi:hypothetical protein
VVHNDRAFGYGEFAAHIAAVTERLERSALYRDRIAILCIHHSLSAAIVGLALRSLGVITANAISLDDITQFDCPGATVISTGFEAQHWPGLEKAAAAAGHPFVLVLADVCDDLGAADIAALRRGGGPGGHILRTSGTTGVYKKVLWDAVAVEELVSLNKDPGGFDESTVFNDMAFPPWTWGGYGWPTMVWATVGCALLSQDRPLWRSYERPATHGVTTPGWLDRCWQPNDKRSPAGGRRVGLGGVGGSALVVQASGLPPRGDPVSMLVHGGL